MIAFDKMSLNSDLSNMTLIATCPLIDTMCVIVFAAAIVPALPMFLLVRDIAQDNCETDALPHFLAERPIDEIRAFEYA